MRTRLVNNSPTGPIECVIEILGNGTVEERISRVAGGRSKPRKPKTTVYPVAIVGASAEEFVKELIRRKLTDGYHVDASESDLAMDLLNVFEVVHKDAWKNRGAQLKEAFQASSTFTGDVEDVRLQGAVIRFSPEKDGVKISVTSIVPRADALHAVAFMLALIGTGRANVTSDRGDETFDATRFVRERDTEFTPELAETLTEWGVLHKRFRWSGMQPKKNAFQMAM